MPEIQEETWTSSVVEITGESWFIDQARYAASMKEKRRPSLSLQDRSVFISVSELGTVSQAIKAHGISQPSTSYALGKMRRAYDDEMLIRSAGNMQLIDNADLY